MVPLTFLRNHPSAKNHVFNIAVVLFFALAIVAIVLGTVLPKKHTNAQTSNDVKNNITDISSCMGCTDSSSGVYSSKTTSILSSNSPISTRSIDMDSGVADNQHTPPPYDYQEIPDFTTTSSKKSTITRTVVVTKHKSTTSLNSVIQSTLPTSLSVSSSVQSSANNNNNIINNVASSFNENGLLWGLTYSPYNTDGSCPDANAVADQLAKVAKVTKNIRLYSTDCSQLENALQAITSNNLGLSIHAGIWISDGQARMQSDLDQFVSAAKKFGTSLIKGVSVGNEDISKGMSESTLIDYINQVRSRLQAEGLGSIPVYTTEQDKLFTFNMAAASDKVVVNIHAIFDSQFYSIDASVQSVIQRANNVKTKVASGKPVVIGETGWSSAGNTGSCPLTLANEIAFAQKFRCAADAAGYTYFYFEAKNAKWKKDAATSEQNFGIFDAGFTPKFDFNLLSVC